MNTNDQKFEIIEASKKPGFKAEDIRKKYGISRTCIFTLLRQKDDFVERMVSSPVAGSAKCLKGVTGLHAEVELRLVRWQSEEAKCQLAITFKIKLKTSLKN